MCINGNATFVYAALDHKIKIIIIKHHESILKKTKQNKTCKQVPS